jgi:hypothetical protein
MLLQLVGVRKHTLQEPASLNLLDLIVYVRCGTAADDLMEVPAVPAKTSSAQ